ncbi:MAG: hypothetical protein DCC68_04425 [Planctomycetota bacterium]|nr:MAG: hypothetical protein DCC68_04425 [Planctomycetota bacterium]
MSSSSKVLLFAVVLTGGICAASLFRKPPGATAESLAPTPAPFAHRIEGPRIVSGPARSETASPHVAEFAASRPAAPRASLGSNSNVPPELPTSSPIGSIPLSAPPSWPIDGGTGERPLGEHGGGRLHRVEDGDTLASLAERYFGDAGRAREIHEANCERLPASGALPIGVDLLIPPASGIAREIPARPASAPSDFGASSATVVAPAAAPSSPATFAEPRVWPSDPASVRQDNPVAPGVIRPASEP